MQPNDRSKNCSGSSPAWCQARRVGAIVGGTLLIVVGAVMLVIPGPGIVAILGGLVLLSAEVAWAHTLLRKVRERVGNKVPLPGVEKIEEKKGE